MRLLPVASAFVIMCLGALICYEAIAPAGFNSFVLEPAVTAQAVKVNPASELSVAHLSALAVLGLGLIFGLKQTAKPQSHRRRLYNRR